MRPLRFLEQSHFLDRLLHRDFKIFEINGFREEVVCAPVHCGADILHVAVSRDDDNFDGSGQAADSGKQRQSKTIKVVIVSAYGDMRSEEHTSELQSRENLVC